jgi:hypothetical protein
VIEVCPLVPSSRNKLQKSGMSINEPRTECVVLTVDDELVLLRWMLRLGTMLMQFCLPLPQSNTLHCNLI